MGYAFSVCFLEPAGPWQFVSEGPSNMLVCLKGLKREMLGVEVKKNEERGPLSRYLRQGSQQIALGLPKGLPFPSTGLHFWEAVPKLN